ncbi:PA3371 family protein [Pseudomonas rhodesiae]|uniref:PA3371 family protein n=1 Tax=Pseudomonas rhodesiae TaxID=76760 RepID=UPI0032B250E5
MSKSAWLFLCLTAATGLYGLETPAKDEQTTALIVSGISACFFVLTLFVGRRIKFDPVLR